MEMREREREICDDLLRQKRNPKSANEGGTCKVSCLLGRMNPFMEGGPSYISSRITAQHNYIDVVFETRLNISKYTLVETFS